MSRIKKALEKAKAQQSSETAAEKADKSQQAPAVSAAVSAPSYFKTKVIKIPKGRFIQNNVITVEENHPVTDQFKLLRTRILQHTRQQGMNTIQVSGFDMDEGKSTVAMNLAISMARDTRQTTLLVDVDFRRPSIHELLGLGPDTPGLKQYFENRVPLEELFINPGIHKLTVLPAGGKITASTEIIGSPAMEDLVQELKKRYPDRYIIFDTPGLNTCPDPLVFSEYVDSILLVARAGVTSTESIKTAMNLVKREKILGTVLNDAGAFESMGYSVKY